MGETSPDVVKQVEAWVHDVEQRHRVEAVVGQPTEDDRLRPEHCRHRARVLPERCHLGAVGVGLARVPRGDALAEDRDV